MVLAPGLAVLAYCVEAVGQAQDARCREPLRRANRLAAGRGYQRTQDDDRHHSARQRAHHEYEGVVCGGRKQLHRSTIPLRESHMSNMAYVRFRNTLPDLQDCYETLRDGFLRPDVEKSPEELTAAKELVKLAQKIAEEFGDQSRMRPVICRACDGLGVVEYDYLSDSGEMETCHDCNGTGRVG